MISSYVKAAVRNAAIAQNRLLFLNQRAKFATSIISERYTKKSQSVRYYSEKNKNTTGRNDGKKGFSNYLNYLCVFFFSIHCSFSMYEDVVEEFFDEELERDLEFLDYASATQGVGLDNLAIQKTKDVLSWEEIAKKGAFECDF